MREQLPAYLLNDLPPAQRTAVEDALAADPELRDELEKLRECLGCCETEAPSEPPQLASRTCHFVEHAIQKSKALCPHVTGAKSLSENHDSLVSRSRWSLLDMSVGVCVLGAFAALLLPQINHSREDSRLYTCQNNQHYIGAALMDNSLQHGGRLPALTYGSPAGAYLMQLVENKIRDREELESHLVCPASELAELVSRNCIFVRIPTRAEYAAANRRQRELLARYMSGSYAYSIGYLDKQGEIHQVNFAGSREIPMLSDAPSPAIAGFQSANHGGCGQNVTFQDLSCRYCRQCKCKAKRDHWFLNDDGKVAPGLHPGDVVLAGSSAIPVIRLIAE